jgi:SIR2-like domain/TIR domain
VEDIDTADPIRRPDGVAGAALTGPALKIFINYRHDDVPFAAAALYHQLEQRFGAENIFFDGGTLKSGMDFLHEIKTSLSGPAGAFIALIGPNWQSALDSRQRREGDDYVMKELELGLRNGWTVIPVLLNGASLPQPGDLPQAIRALSGYQFAQLRQGSLDIDIRALVGRLDEISAQQRHEPVITGPGPVIPEQPDDITSGAVQAPEIFPADDEHYEELVEEADNLVIFLGAGANADDHEGPFQAGGLMLPDDSDLAEYLAAKVRYKSGQRELAEVAQYARMVRGEPRMLSWVKEIIAVDSEPGPVHTYLAGLPARLEQLKLEKRYQMIVTPKFDVALEQALLKAKQPFDVAVYMAPGTQHAGRFVHIPWESRDARPIVTPNEYDQFPILGDNLELTKTVIVRINGAVDDDKAGYRWKQNYVITEDHYIDYLGGRPAEEVVPMQILAKLRQASCLFLGYTIADWRLRVFLHWIWPGERPSGATHWAVERDPDTLERRFWQRSGVPLYRSRLTDYIQGFDRFLVTYAKDRDALP